jgi:hypothetical protein
MSVVPVSESDGVPQEEQNLAFEETCAPHFEQNMGGGILSSVPVLP